jgi:osmotically inducible protein OsmC
MKTLFETSATHVGGSQDGHVQSQDRMIDLDVKRPGKNGNNDAKYSNAEQLLAAGYATCFAESLEAVAKLQRLEDLGDYSVTATIAYNREEDGYFLEATLDSYLPTVNKAKGKALIKAAHEICPYSKATRDNITVTLNLLQDE